MRRSQEYPACRNVASANQAAAFSSTCWKARIAIMVRKPGVRPHGLPCPARWPARLRTGRVSVTPSAAKSRASLGSCVARQIQVWRLASNSATARNSSTFSMLLRPSKSMDHYHGSRERLRQKEQKNHRRPFSGAW